MTGSGVSIPCLIDGAPWGQIPVSDRGLCYGDGLFETLLVRDSRCCQWRRHWNRLIEGCGRLGIPAPSQAMIAGEVARLLGDAGDGVLKILVTRGEGGRGYAPPRGARPRRILTLHPLPEHPPEWRSGGVVIRICRTPATGNPALAGLKHLNRLDSVLARAEWSAPDIAEGILTGPEGEIIGGTMTNLFLWNGALLQTPAIDRCGVAGTVRALAMDLAARQGIPCVETQLSREALLEARGAFLTNSVVGVWPVRRLEDRHYDPQDLPLDLMRALELEAENQEGGP